MLAAIGWAAGGALAVPMLLGLARLAAPFMNMPQDAGPLDLLPPGLWMVLAGLPLLAGGLGWLTAQVTVRAWVRRLP
ncbi:MAG: cell division protein FtsX, partial [Acetobacteraceae bacterium]|nr:cell division protein FtsX [Acetobacteraceae bacterium]